MLDKETIIKVKNRSTGTVGYVIPDLGNLYRLFQKDEVKEIPMEELRKLSYQPGGLQILRECLILDNKEAIRELLQDVEPEYYYTEEDLQTLLLSGSMDQFLDCLDFAPEGTIDLIKALAVKIEIPDMRKREAILEKTGFDVTSAIRIKKESKIVPEEETKVRRTTRLKTESTTPAVPTRRYKVVSQQ